VRWIRGFSSQAGQTPGTIDLEDGSQSMRQELDDLFFILAEHKVEEISSEHDIPGASQSLGIQTSGVPYRGYKSGESEFWHGMTVNFSLSGAEGDFTYVACVGAILLLTRTADS
jgi:hypothetical protein